jgi:hypothetical protein
MLKKEITNELYYLRNFGSLTRDKEKVERRIEYLREKLLEKNENK